MVKKSGVDIEKIMNEVRRRAKDKQREIYSDEEILEMLNVDPGEPLDKRSIRADFSEEIKFADPFAEYLGKGGGLKGKIIRVIRRLFWPVSRLLMNYGFLLNRFNQHIQLMHNLTYELTLLKIDNDRLRDGYQVLIHKLEQLQARERELEKMLSEINDKK